MQRCGADSMPYIQTLIVLSGPIAAGKSSLATNLVKGGWAYFSTRKAIKGLLGDGTREELQARGKELDRDRPNWIWEEMVDLMAPGLSVIDSVRTETQIDLIRKYASATGLRVVHIHLTASDEELKRRYAKRNEVSDYASVKSDSIESNLYDLQSSADLVIDTGKCTSDDTFVLCMAAAGIDYGTNCVPNVDVLVGGQYGSEGKGHVVAHIAPEYDCLVRVGGPNAGHSVLYQGKHVSFYHLPSGILHNHQAMIILGAGININPTVLMKEIELAESLGVQVRNRIHIDRNANLISKLDIEAEKALVASIGSTGQGVGVATANRILERSIRDEPTIHNLPPGFGVEICDTQELLEEFYNSEHKVLVEGTQGTGLSLYHGHYPHVTSRDTTVSGTIADAGIAPGRIRKVVMVVRTNPIRVQNPGGEGKTSGPMGKEIAWEDIAARAGVDAGVLREREKTTTTKRQRRVSEFDWGLLQRSSVLNCPTDIALTFADYLSPENTRARRYDQLTPETQNFIQNVEMVSKAPVSMVTTRLHERSIIDRRKW